MTREEFRKMTDDKIFYLDGATGTNLYAAGMPKGVCTEKWVMENPQILQNLQREYAQAGSQMVYASTFGANRHMLAAFDLADQVEEINRKLVEISKEAVGDQAFVAGDISMSGMMLEDLGGEDTEEDIYEVYREQAAALSKTDIDLVGVETMICADEAVIAVKAMRDVMPDMPIVCTITIGAGGRTLYGDRPAEAAKALVEAGADAVGVNCSEGPDGLLDIIKAIKEAVSVPVIAKPNAGHPIPDGKGGSTYGMKPAAFAGYMKALYEAGATMLGGCCGTTPEYIKMLKQVLEGDIKLI